MINPGFGLPKALKGHSLARIGQHGENVTIYPCPVAAMCLGEHFVLPTAVARTYINSGTVDQFLQTTAELQGDIPLAGSILQNLVGAAGVTDSSVQLNDADLSSMSLADLKGLLRTYYLDTAVAEVLITDNAMYILSHNPTFTAPKDSTNTTHFNCRLGHDELSALCALCDKGYAGGSTVVCNDCQSTAIIWRLVGIIILFILAYVLLVSVPMKMVAKRRVRKLQMQNSAQADGYILVGEGEDDQASIQVYTKILVSHFQVLLQFHIVMDIDWPASFQTFLDYLSIIKGDILTYLNIKCALPLDLYVEFIAAMLIIPVAMMIGFIVQLVYSVRDSSEPKARPSPFQAQTKELSGNLVEVEVAGQMVNAQMATTAHKNGILNRMFVLVFGIYPFLTPLAIPTPRNCSGGPRNIYKYKSLWKVFPGPR
jgi:hypothetical protein